MRRLIFPLALTAALLLCGAGGASAALTCYQIPVPAVPAVYETVVTPAVTVTEYEFTHAQDGNGNSKGHGPANKWVADPNWNAEGNPQSVGWVATGNTRVRVLETEKVTVTLVTPEVPATVREECVELPDGVPPINVGDPEVPLGNLDPVAPPAETPPAPPAAEVPAPVNPAPPAAVPAPLPPAAPVAANAPAAYTPPAELAYTGAADWILPASLALIVAGAGGIALTRRYLKTN